MKKKLSVLAALATVVTVGGVYATWNYATETAEPTEKVLAIGMSTAVLQGKMGSITVDMVGGIQVENAGHYVAELNYVLPEDVTSESGPYFLINFTPATGADLSKVVLDWTVEVTQAFEYEGEEVITMVTKTGVFNPVQGYTSTKVFFTELNIQLAPNIILDTHQEYQNFAATLEAGEIKITVEQRAL